jgi:hypothetical protein
MRLLVKVVVGGAVLALFSSAQAKDQAGPCQADLEKFCKDVQPGEGRILACMKSHETDVSPKCAKHMKAVEAQVKHVAEACKPDVEKFCFDTPVGKGGVVGCLKQHADELSPDCKTAIAKAKAQKK